MLWQRLLKKLEWKFFVIFLIRFVQSIQQSNESQIIYIKKLFHSRMLCIIKKLRFRSSFQPSLFVIPSFDVRKKVEVSQGSTRKKTNPQSTRKKTNKFITNAKAAILNIEKFMGDGSICDEWGWGGWRRRVGYISTIP